MIAWQSVTKAMPADLETVLGFVPGRGEGFDQYVMLTFRTKGSTWRDDCKTYLRPTHWARLNPPENA